MESWRSPNRFQRSCTVVRPTSAITNSPTHLTLYGREVHVAAEWGGGRERGSREAGEKGCGEEGMKEGGREGERQNRRGVEKHAHLKAQPMNIPERVSQYHHSRSNGLRTEEGKNRMATEKATGRRDAQPSKRLQLFSHSRLWLALCYHAGSAMLALLYCLLNITHCVWQSGEGGNHSNFGDDVTMATFVMMVTMATLVRMVIMATSVILEMVTMVTSL